MANKNKSLIGNKIHREIIKLLKSPTIEELDSKYIEKIAKSVYLDRLKSEFEKEIKKYRIDTDALIADWQNQYKSQDTKRTYAKNISLFIAWLGQDKGKSLIEVDNRLADNYISHVTKLKLSDNTKRLRIFACSSLFQQLVRWEVVNKNPFLKARLIPKKELELKKISEIPSAKELDLLERIAESAISATGIGSVRKRNGAKKAMLAIRIMKETGLRIGALGNLKIDKTGNFRTVSKGRKIYGKLSLKILDLIKYLDFNETRPLLNYKRNTFSMWMFRVSKKIKMKNYGPHSIRHWFAVRFYKENKDLVALQKALGHKSVGSTQSYLATLENHLEN